MRLNLSNASYHNIMNFETCHIDTNGKCMNDCLGCGPNYCRKCGEKYGELNKEDILQSLKICKMLNIRRIYPQVSGEFFMNNNILDILQNLPQDFEYNIDTTGLCITENILRFLYNTTLRINISISIWGYDWESYDKYQGGNFSIVNNNIDHLIEISKANNNIRIMFTVANITLEQCTKTVNYINDKLCHNHIIPNVTRTWTNDNYTIFIRNHRYYVGLVNNINDVDKEHAMLKNNILTIYDYYDKSRIRNVKIDDPLRLSYLFNKLIIPSHQDYNWSLNHYNKVKFGYCDASHTLIINTDGKIHPCYNIYDDMYCMSIYDFDINKFTIIRNALFKCDGIHCNKCSSETHKDNINEITTETI